MRNNCGHAWKPIDGWDGRYRCYWCKAIAYKNLVNGGARGNPCALSVYVCAYADCHEPAIQKRPKQRCSEHLDTSRRGRKTEALSRTATVLPSTPASPDPDSAPPAESSAPPSP